MFVGTVEAEIVGLVLVVLVVVVVASSFENSHFMSII